MLKRLDNRGVRVLQSGVLAHENDADAIEQAIVTVRLFPGSE